MLGVHYLVRIYWLRGLLGVYAELLLVTGTGVMWWLELWEATIYVGASRKRMPNKI